MSEEAAIESAREIALEVMSQREAGEQVTDEQVLAAHPELRERLAEQLKRLRALEVARNTPLDQTDEWRRADESSAEPSQQPSLPQIDALASIRMTTIADDSEEEIARRTEVVHDSGNAEPDGDVDPPSPAQLYRPKNRPPMAFLKFYADGSRLFKPIPIATDTFLIGRNEGDLTIDHDPHVSGRHAEIRRVYGRDGNYAWELVDLDSTNGTFVGVDHVILKPDDEVLIGQETYRFIQERGRAGFNLVADDCEETSYLQSDVVWLGRAVDDAMQSMRKDPFVDANHAILRFRSGNWLLINNDSLNGVWYRIKQVVLRSSCVFQVGEQRLGFRI